MLNRQTFIHTHSNGEENIMKTWLNGLAAKATTAFAKMRDNERGDIVQTLMIIAIAVVLIGIVLFGLRESINACLDSDFTDCFGVRNLGT